jgi:hypothetical protein
MDSEKRLADLPYTLTPGKAADHFRAVGKAAG